MFNINEENRYVSREAFTRFMGTGLYIGLFLMSILYIIYNMKKEDAKEKKIRIVLGIYSIIVLALNMCPLFTKWLTAVLGETATYWRVYWLLPVGIVIAFTFTDMIVKRKKIKEKISLFVLIICTICLSGKFMYQIDTGENFKNVNNYYKVPDDILDIIQHVSEDKSDYKKLAGINEFAVYTRQIDGNIILAEGRSMSGNYANNSIVTYINNHDLKAICDYCSSNECNYLVVYKDIEFPNEYVLGYDIKELYQNENYCLYKFNRVLGSGN